MQKQSAVLSHVNEHGKANMVDVTDKKITQRQAVAEGKVFSIAL